MTKIAITKVSKMERNGLMKKFIGKNVKNFLKMESKR